jgi:hypothetical protein
LVACSKKTGRAVNSNWDESATFYVSPPDEDHACFSYAVDVLVGGDIYTVLSSYTPENLAATLSGLLAGVDAQAGTGDNLVLAHTSDRAALNPAEELEDPQFTQASLRPIIRSGARRLISWLSYGTASWLSYGTVGSVLGLPVHVSSATDTWLSSTSIAEEKGPVEICCRAVEVIEAVADRCQATRFQMRLDRLSRK